MHNFVCGKEQDAYDCTLNYIVPEGMVKSAVAKLSNPSVTIVDTDLYSYMILQVCYGIGVAHDT